jgi:quercetin dioxygenase-like cupin family protein
VNMRQPATQISIMLVLALCGLFVIAAEDSGIPEHERQIAQQKGFEGPTETKGIESSVALGAIPLGDDFPALEGRVLRARVVTLLPGGTIQAHEHDSRPGIAYILEGELIETRNDSAGPIVRGPGAVSLEKSGVVHWWVNEGPEKARAVIVDIAREDPGTR